MSTKEDRWGYILELYQNNKYNECLKESENFFEILKICSDEDFLWKVKFQISLCLIELGKIKQSINCAKSSLQYAITLTQQSKVFWMLGYCYDSIDRKKAIKYYDRAYMNYLSIKKYDFAYATLFNSARLRGNILEMENAVKLLESAENDDANFLETAYDDLFEQYISRGLVAKAYDLIINIKNSKIKEKLVAKARKLLVVGGGAL